MQRSGFSALALELVMNAPERFLWPFRFGIALKALRFDRAFEILEQQRKIENGVDSSCVVSRAFGSSRRVLLTDGGQSQRAR